MVALLVLVTCLTGCAGGTKSFTCKELTMTVPSKMRDVSTQSDFSSYTFALDSKDIAIFGLKESFSDFDGELTLKEYADLVIEANKLDTHAVQRATGQYYYFQYDASTDGGFYRYLGAVYEGKDGFWMVQIAASLTAYEESTFFDYLDSVRFS